MPTRRVWIITDDSAQEKWKGFAWKLEERISLQVADGCGRLGFSFSYGTLCLLIKRTNSKILCLITPIITFHKGNLRIDV